MNAFDLETIPGYLAPEVKEGFSRLISEHGCKTGIEVGCFMGKSSVYLAQRLEHLFCVDKWADYSDISTVNNLAWTLNHWGFPHDFFSFWRDNVIRAGQFAKITPIRGDSRAVHDQVTPADIVYIDADHSYAGCVSDIKLYGAKALRVICGDDYDEVPGFDVIRACGDVLGQVQHTGRFWWVTKRPDEQWRMR